MNRLDDSCYDERYGSSFDEDRFNGNRFFSRRSSMSLGRRNSMSRRYSIGCYDDNRSNRRFPNYFNRRPFGINSINRFERNRFMNIYPGHEYFGYVDWYPRSSRFDYDRFGSNNFGYNDYANNSVDNYRFDY